MISSRLYILSLLAVFCFSIKLYTHRSPMSLKAAHSQSVTFGGVKFHEPLSSSLVQMEIQNSPSPIQIAALPSLCSGLSCILHAATGSGKTFAYLLPALKRIYSSNMNDRKMGQVWIVAPTRELVSQIEYDIHLLTKDKSIATTFIRQRPRRQLQETRDTEIITPIVIGTPMRLLELILSENGKDYSSQIEYLVLDEIDRLIPIESRYKSHSLTTKKHMFNSPKYSTLKFLSCLNEYHASMQVVCASATVGRPLWRETCHLVTPIANYVDKKSNTSKNAMNNFPIIRPAEAYLVDIDARNQAAESLRKVQKEIRLKEKLDDFAGNCYSDNTCIDKQLLTQANQSTRYIGIPSSIKHVLLVDESLEQSSLAKRLSLFNKMLKKTLHLSSKRILLFLPEAADIVQAVNILKFWRNDNIVTVSEARQILAQGEEQPTASPMIIVAAFSGTRGLHLPGIDTVFVSKPPKSMDEYLHLAGRTGRLDCTSKLRKSYSGQACQVITIADFEETKRMNSWQTPLGISLNHITNL